jgi:hypothetical protein
LTLRRQSCSDGSWSFRQIRGPSASKILFSPHHVRDRDPNRKFRSYVFGMRDFVDSERPQWLQQMEPILETLNEGVVIGNDSSEILFVNAVFEYLGV